MKVFAMNDCDWMAAETLEEAKAAYLKDYAGGLSMEEALDNAHELSDEDMQRFKFVDDSEEATESGRRSFRDHLDKLIAAGAKFPCFFASTEF